MLKLIITNILVFTMLAGWFYAFVVLLPPMLTSSPLMAFALIALGVIVPGTIIWHKYWAKPPTQEASK